MRKYDVIKMAIKKDDKQPLGVIIIKININFHYTIVFNISFMIYF